ncbi:MAG: hypothetical protein EZS28_033535, partial [Streblomastix strix]
GELVSECQIGVCINYNDPAGCGCASVESDQQGYNNSDCLEDKSFAQLSECNEGSGTKVEEGSCKCTSDYAPEGCKCARDDEVFNFKKSQCEKAKYQSLQNCSNGNSVGDRLCKCCEGNLPDGCICTNDYHPEQCICDSGSEEFDISRCTAAKDVCINENQDTPEGCTPKCEIYHYQNSENCLCGTSGELVSECQIGVCINYNDPAGCGCASVESDQQGYNNSDCLEDKSFAQLSECNEGSGTKVEEGSCKCTSDYAPEGCKCARDDELVIDYANVVKEIFQMGVYVQMIIIQNNCPCLLSNDPRISICNLLLQRVEVIVNTSNSYTPLQFTFDGDNFRQGVLYIKIDELRNLTDEEIKKQEKDNEEIWKKYHPKQFNSEELLRDEDGFIIWPPENATKLPIYERMTVINNQQGSLSMTDYSWLDCRKKVYGMQISNDNNTLYGIDGKTDKDSAVQIIVDIQEGEQFYNFQKDQYKDDEVDPFPFWLIIIFGVIAAIILTIFVFFSLNRKQQRKIENKAGLTILRALLWNRDYHASRPAFELMRQQRNVVQELIDSEKNYISKLEICVKYFLKPLQKYSKDGKIKVNQSQIKDIFINMEQILNFHKLFSQELQTVAKNWTVHSRIGQMFCKQAPFMKISVEYFQKKEKASKLLKELLKSDPKFNQIVDDITDFDEV